MQGYQLSFFTQQDRRHGALPLGEWLLQEARRLGVRGATLSPASQGFGHDRTLHAAHFFELADRPVEVTMAVTADEADALLRRLAEERLRIFYIKTPVEFGMTGGD